MMNMKPFSFIEAGREKTSALTQVMLYIVTTIIIVVFTMIPQIPMVFLFINDIDAMQSLDFAAVGISEPIGMMFMLIPFAFGLIGLFLAVRYLHKRPAYSIINPTNRINWRKFFIGMAIWVVLGSLMEVVGYFIDPSNYEYTFDASRFFPVLIVVLILIPFQSSFEEVLFRGYYLQGLGNAIRKPWIAMLLTSIMFGLLHFMNPEVEEFGSWILLYYIGVGVFFGIITLMDESVELAMGMHSANNIFGAMIVTFPSSVFQTPALFSIKEVNVQLMIFLWLIMCVIAYFICNKLFNWGGIDKIFATIPRATPEPTNEEEIAASTEESTDENLLP